MNRKLLTIQLTTIFLSTLLAVFINLLTNDKNVNDWLTEKGVGTRTLFGIIFFILVLALVLEYFKFRSPDTSDDKGTIIQNQRSGDNSQNYQAGGDININQKR